MPPNAAAFWDRLAPKYAAQPVADPDAFERKIERTKALMTPDDVVLDIGCGTGSFALIIAPFAKHVHGLDVSDEMNRIAREKAAEQGVDNVTFHVGAFDASFGALEDESLDGICAYSILHLVEDRAAALQHIYRLLKPGGFFVTSTVCLKESWVPFRPILAVMRWLNKAPMVKIFSKKDLARDIEAAGFVDLRQPDVGAKPVVGFMLAQKPAS